jgi:hypothetical protein
LIKADRISPNKAWGFETTFGVCNPKVIMSGFTKIEMSSFAVDYLPILGGQDGRRGQGINECEGVKAAFGDPSSDGEEGQADRSGPAFRFDRPTDSSAGQASSEGGG